MAKKVATYEPDMPVRELVRAAEAVHPSDCAMTRRFLRQVERGQHGTSQRKILAAARTKLGPRATILDNIIAFLEKIIPIIMPFIVKGRRAKG